MDGVTILFGPARGMSGSRRDAAAGCSRGGDDEDEPPSWSRAENTYLDRGRIEPQHMPSPRSLDSKRVPLRRENGAANSYVGGGGVRTEDPRPPDGGGSARCERRAGEGYTAAPREGLVARETVRVELWMKGA